MSKNIFSIFAPVIEGTLVSGKFFTRYWLQIFVILAMLLIYITNRYSCQRSMEEIRRLNDRLAIVQSESYRVRGIYMSRIRESEMREMLDTLHLGLSVQTQPPFRVAK
ncbi:MAG: FtsL-like putative cell division protein [Bacteroides sp.]|nr:FtsL-like putative cell division protein [Bacteroides sp.]MCM1379207.1 FtsL-like putative cell division protein [Bacteroides sp.]MCM1445144.1 FtsL-like putative cell division protein [Prevotella sp.]